METKEGAEVMHPVLLVVLTGIFVFTVIFYMMTNKEVDKYEH
jgi:hypothetical protein